MTPTRRCSASAAREPAALLDDDQPAVALTRSHRCSAAVARAVNAVTQPAPRAQPAPTSPDAEGVDGSLATRLAASAHAEATLIADELRRAHLIDGVPWSQMAVIVRSMPRVGARAGACAGQIRVPVRRRRLPAARFPIIPRCTRC